MSRTATDLTIMIGTFVGVTALAAAFGAANMGTAMGFGQIAFAIALLYVILRPGS